MFPLFFRVAVQVTSRHSAHARRACASIRFNSNISTKPVDNTAENVNVGHSRFLAESSRHSRWKEDPNVPMGHGGLDNHSDDDADYDALQGGKGVCSACSA